MNRYALDLSADTRRALSELKSGIVSVSVWGKCADGFTDCAIQGATGRTVLLSAGEAQLETKFEVFPIKATLGQPKAARLERALVLRSPVEIVLLKTEDWLTSELPEGPTIGNNPLMQFQGRAAAAPSSAKAACVYFGGCEFRDQTQRKLLVVTGAFPFSLFISGFDGCNPIERGNYEEIPLRV